MQPVEALTVLIAVGDAALSNRSGTFPITPDSEFVEDPLTEAQEKVKLSVAVCQAMLNTALPVARWRAFVQIESGKEKGCEYTVSGVKIEDIISALYPLTLISRNIYVTLWEQRSTGADMIEGYQGSTRSMMKKSFRVYIDGLRKHSTSGLAN